MLHLKKNKQQLIEENQSLTNTLRDIYNLAAPFVDCKASEKSSPTLNNGINRTANKIFSSSRPSRSVNKRIDTFATGDELQFIHQHDRQFSIAVRRLSPPPPSTNIRQSNNETFKFAKPKEPPSSSTKHQQRPNVHVPERITPGTILQRAHREKSTQSKRPVSEHQSRRCLPRKAAPTVLKEFTQKDMRALRKSMYSQ